MKEFKTKFPEKYKYYSIDLNNPIEELRADLKAIPLAIKQGYNVIEGETFADAVTFKKGNIKIWGVRWYVAKAELIDDIYTNHRPYDTYKEALMKKQSLKSFVWELMSRKEVVTDQKVCNFLGGAIPNGHTINEYKRQYLKRQP